EKTLARKVQEVFLTWWLETALDKSRILELYLNVIEYGPAVYGISHAAEHYFGRTPAELSLPEAAFLASILPNPKLYHGQDERGPISASLGRRMRFLMRHMHARGRIDQAALDHALVEMERFSFHREGAPRPESRELVGATEPLPFGTQPDAAGWDPFAEGFEDPMPTDAEERTR